MNLSEENYYEARNISPGSFDKVVDKIVYEKPKIIVEEYINPQIEET